MADTEQSKINVTKIEKRFGDSKIPVLCAPGGTFVKDGKTIDYPNRVKVGNGFKTIADFRSIDQINAVSLALADKRIRAWLEANLPQSTEDPESEVEE